MRLANALPVLPLILVSCASTSPAAKSEGTSGEPARPAQVVITLPAGVDPRAVARSIVPCRTTETELRRRLGEPSRDGILHGDRIMTWIFRTETPSTYIGVLIDNRGVVVDLYWDVPTEVPWVPANQCVNR